jgi:hypothetical protein
MGIPFAGKDQPRSPLSGAVFSLLVLVCFLTFPPSLPAADLPTGEIEDDSYLRLSLKNTWFTESPGRTLANKPFIHTMPGGGRIEVRAETAGGEFMVILAREWNNTFPGWAQGSWILTRRRDTGEASRIRIFLRSDPYTYIQFRPLNEERVQMDAVVYDGYVIRSLPLPVSLDRIMELPVETVLDLAGSKFPRRYYDPMPELYRDLRSFIAHVRERLPELSFRDDGAIDDKGRYVFINTLEVQNDPPGLNCSGFAKWITDGIRRPFTGDRLAVPPLKEPSGSRTSSYSEALEVQRDPFFGLDWTRNLAAAAGTAVRTSSFGTLEEIEVRKNSFASVIMRTPQGSSIRPYPGFLPDAGFGAEGIHPLLYTLAIDEPGHIYLASINGEMGRPRMRQHFHVAVLIPYFNEYGNFQVAVFESAGETPFTAFKNRYPGHYINLVRIFAEDSFDP